MSHIKIAPGLFGIRYATPPFREQALDSEKDDLCRTHVPGLKCFISNRDHHLLKTFYGGPGGWTDEQLPDGTVIFTAPTGHTYTSEAHGATLFPVLATPTGEPDISTPDAPTADRALMMPTRKQTREQERRNRIAAERRKRSAIIAEEERRHQARLAADQEPPPF